METWKKIQTTNTVSENTLRFQCYSYAFCRCRFYTKSFCLGPLIQFMIGKYIDTTDRRNLILPRTYHFCIETAIVYVKSKQYD